MKTCRKPKLITCPKINFIDNNLDRIPFGRRKSILKTHWKPIIHRNILLLMAEVDEI
jgi:hypothetical protein